jgi:hypothetical protein
MNRQELEMEIEQAQEMGEEVSKYDLLLLQTYESFANDEELYEFLHERWPASTEEDMRECAKKLRDEYARGGEKWTSFQCWIDNTCY